jgi:hypothetical protein
MNRLRARPRRSGSREPGEGNPGRLVIPAPAAGAAVLVLAGLLFLGLPSAGAGTVRGSLTTTAYAYEGGGGLVPGPGTGGTDDAVTWLLQRVRLDAYPGAVNGPLSFHLSLTARNQADHQSLDDTRTRLYHGYLRYRPQAGFDLRLGRHFTHAGVATGIADGATLRLRHRDWADVTVLVGTLGMESREDLRFDGPKDSRRWGGMFRLTLPRHRVFGASAGASFATTWRGDEEDEKLLGLHARLEYRKFLRGRFEWRRDLILDRTIGTRIGLEYLDRRGRRVWGEFQQRKPLLRARSFFASFATQARDELRGGVTQPLGGSFSLIADGAVIGYEDAEDDAQSLQVSLAYGTHRVGWRVYRGLGGDQDRLVGASRVNLGRRLALYGSLDVASYDRGNILGERDDSAVSLTVGTDYRPHRAWSLRGQIEALDHPSAARDLRLLAEVAYRFGWRL